MPGLLTLKVMLTMGMCSRSGAGGPGDLTTLASWKARRLPALLTLKVMLTMGMCSRSGAGEPGDLSTLASWKARSLPVMLTTAEPIVILKRHKNEGK